MPSLAAWEAEMRYYAEQDKKTLAKTIRELRARIKELEAELDELKSSEWRK